MSQQHYQRHKNRKVSVEKVEEVNNIAIKNGFIQGFANKNKSKKIQEQVYIRKGIVEI